MLVQIHKVSRAIAVLLLLVASGTLISCASPSEKVALVKDPDAQKGDSMIPWNKQEKWESSGQLGGVTDRR